MPNLHCLFTVVVIPPTQHYHHLLLRQHKLRIRWFWSFAFQGMLSLHPLHLLATEILYSDYIISIATNPAPQSPGPLYSLSWPNFKGRTQRAIRSGRFPWISDWNSVGRFNGLYSTTTSSSYPCLHIKRKIGNTCDTLECPQPDQAKFTVLPNKILIPNSSNTQKLHH